MEVTELLQDLRREHQTKIAEARELESLIRAIEKRISTNGEPTTPITGPYTAMTLKDAILDVLRGADGALKSSEIAAKVQAGGVRSDAKDFNQNVSASLSMMKKGNPKKNIQPSVRLTDGKWEISMEDDLRMADPSTAPEQPS